MSMLAENMIPKFYSNIIPSLIIISMLPSSIFVDFVFIGGGEICRGANSIYYNATTTSHTVGSVRFLLPRIPPPYHLREVDLMRYENV